MYEEAFEDAPSESESQSQPDAQAGPETTSNGRDQLLNGGSNPLFTEGNTEVLLTGDNSASHADSMTHEVRKVTEGADYAHTLSQADSYDADSAVISHANLAPLSLGLLGQGPTQQPFTPTASPSLFTPAGDITDDVDAFSKTLNANPLSPAKPDQAMPTTQGLARVHSGLRAALSGEVDLTPSYRHQVRSMGQATDNEHPFRSTMPFQSNADSAQEPASDGGKESLPPAPTSHQNSTGMRRLSRPSSAAVSRQSSLNKPASLAPSSRQPSFGGNTMEQSTVVSHQQSNVALMSYSRQSSKAASPIISRQPSNVGSAVVSRQPSIAASVTLSRQSSTAPGLSRQASSRATAVISRQASAKGDLSKQPNNVPSAVPDRQASTVAVVSRQVSNTGGFSKQSSTAASPVLSRQPSNTASAVLSKQPSSVAPAVVSRQISNTGGFSRQSSTAASPVLGRQPSNTASAGLGKQPSSVASAVVSRQSSITGGLSKQPSNAGSSSKVGYARPAEPVAVSRQLSHALSSGLSQEGSYAVAGGISKEASGALSAQPSYGLSREGSYAVAGGSNKEASGTLSTQPSYALSREGSYAAAGSLSKQPSYIPVSALSTSSRKGSLGARLLKETSQVLPPEGSEGQLADDILAGSEAAGGKAWRETSQAVYIEADEDWVPASETVLKQQASDAETHPDQGNLPVSSGPSRQASLQNPVSRQSSTAAAAATAGGPVSNGSKQVSRQASLTQSDSGVSSLPSKPVSRQQSITPAAAKDSSSPAVRGRAVSRQPSMASSGAGSLPASNAASRQQSMTPVYTKIPSRQPSMTATLPSPTPTSRQPSLVAPATANNTALHVSSKPPSRQTSLAVNTAGTPMPMPESSQVPLTAPPTASSNANVRTSAKVPSREASLTANGGGWSVPRPISRQPSVTGASPATVASPARAVSRQPSVNNSHSSSPASKVASRAVSRQPSITATAAASDAASEEGSLAALRRQLSTSRKAATAAAPTMSNKSEQGGPQS